MDFIRIRGARTHNLKNIDLDLPRDKLIVITGLSGSGKSSLAFDTIYAEGQRRYVESLSAYARQFLSVMEKPDVDHIEGLSPAISIEQKSTSHNPRSTVGTITEIYDYLRLLYRPRRHSALPGPPLPAGGADRQPDGRPGCLAQNPEQRYMLLAPVVRERKGEHVQVFEQLRAQGYRARARRRRAVRNRRGAGAGAAPEAHHRSGDRPLQAARRPQAAPGRDLRDRAEARRRHGRLVLAGQSRQRAGMLFSSKYSCPVCDYSLPELEPRLFSFNSPMGACPTCDGLGVAAVLRSRRASSCTRN